MPRRKGFYSLKKPRIRQSWNKHNLYNLWNLRPWSLGHKTFFQQKWAAKSLTRGYHGEQIRERTWNHMFSRYIPSVVSMDPEVLARSDGADMAAGRGAGRNRELIEQRPRLDQITPYMGMVYWPMERRLDTAIFRALFASSARQARQMVVHGFVKVNGKKMRFPGYLLNPGDMFSVDPEMVLFATGTPKGTQPYMPYAQRRAAQEAQGKEAEDEDVDDEADEPEPEQSAPESDEAAAGDPSARRKKALLSLRKEIKEFEAKESDNISAKRKQALRKLRRESAKLAAKPHLVEDALLAAFQSEFAAVVASVSKALPKPAASSSSVDGDDNSPSSSSGSSTSSATPAAKLQPPPSHASALKRARQANVYNPLKKYKTPWEPRKYMSAFAFVPRYLEVNQNVCSAVYLRHPVARPGLCEVPSPFSTELSQLAHNWYLRRR